MKDFKNKVAVITGAGSGMGRELAIELASAGANIALVEVNEETLNETADFLKKYNVCLLYTSPSPRDPKSSRMPSSA